MKLLKKSSYMEGQHSIITVCMTEVADKWSGVGTK
jgi:hypothetical protein